MRINGLFTVQDLKKWTSFILTLLERKPADKTYVKSLWRKVRYKNVPQIHLYRFEGTAMNSKMGE